MIPTPQMRLRQYNLNKNTLQALTSIQPSQPNDWVVTVSFYSALHIVEKNLISKGKKTIKHEDRNRMVIKDQEFGIDVADAYRALYNESKSSGYDCIPFSKKRADDALVYLKEIESILV